MMTCSLTVVRAPCDMVSSVQYKTEFDLRIWQTLHTHVEWLQIKISHPPASFTFFMLDLLSFADAFGKFFPNMGEGTSCAGMQVFLPTPSSGGLLAFSGDGLVPSKLRLS